MVLPADVPKTAINVLQALWRFDAGDYVATVVLRKKIAVADIANASLAGGVAIGSTCDKVGPDRDYHWKCWPAPLSTFGFAIIQPRLQGS